MQTDAQKLTAVEAALRRWHTRLTRATNAIRKLEAKRRRLGKPTTLADRDVKKVERHRRVTETVPLPELDAFFTIPKDAPTPAHLDEAHVETLDIPADLKRSDPLIAERMKAARKKAEAEARTKMPLSGKDAQAAIKAVKRKKA